MSDNEAKARDLVAEAEKKLTAKPMFGGLFGGGGKIEDALEMFARAANLFKMAKKWGDAGKTFTRIADLHKKSGNTHDAATNYVDASTCFKKSDPKEAAASLQKAIDIYTESGRFTIAAKHHQTIAEIFEGEAADLEKAMHHYQQSADFFRGEESNSSANKCMLKVAEFAGKLEQYEKAVGIYEKVAGDALESSLLKYSAKEYFFRASLCHLCIDALNATLAIQKYGDLYPAFGDSREAKLIRTLAKTVEDQDVEAYTAATQEFDSISRLEAFHTTLLLRVKKQIPVEDDLC